MKTLRHVLASIFIVAGCVTAFGSGLLLAWPEMLQAGYAQFLPDAFVQSGSAGREGASAPKPGTPIGVLEIPRLGLSSIVLEGDEHAALLLGVGHLSETPLPWHGGNSVLAAHRDTFFRPLEGIRRNDVITFTTADARLEYIVKGTKIVEPTDLEALTPASSATLTLITCFPFHYIGPAPQRFVVTAERRPAGA